MSDSLKDQLLGLGFKPAPREESRKPRPSQGKPHGKPQGGRPQSNESRNSGPQHGRPPARQGQGKPQHKGEIDLAKAFAIRAQKEKDERIAAERQRQEEAKLRREAKAKLTDLLTRTRLNDEAAEIARHFDYGGKIRRIHVTADQLKALNGGELAVVQMGGRYHLLRVADAEEAERILPGSLALQVDPNAPPGEDEYADPQFQVPDDLVW